MKNIYTKSAKTYNDNKKINRPINLPIYQTTTFQAESSLHHGKVFKEGDPNFYTRFGHPNLVAAGDKVANLENAESGLVFSSGMAAITTTLLTFLKAGDHIIAQTEIFAQTYTFLENVCKHIGIEVDFIDARNTEEVLKCIKPATKIIYIESPSNPILDIIDINAIAAIGKEFKILTIIDSTFASPYCQTPIGLGISLVVHSATKFLGGHSDIMCGAVAGSTEHISQIKKMQILLGGIMDPHAAWLLMRGLKTLAIRMEKICSNALAVAEFLSAKKGVNRVSYPLLQGSTFYDIAKKQMTGGGGVVSFEVSGGICATRKFLDALQLIPIATSLGGVETVVEVPYDLDFNEEELGVEGMGKRRITPGFIRLSVGIEDKNDIIDDLQRGIQTITN